MVALLVLLVHSKAQTRIILLGLRLLKITFMITRDNITSDKLTTHKLFSFKSMYASSQDKLDLARR